MRKYWEYIKILVVVIAMIAIGLITFLSSMVVAVILFFLLIGGIVTVLIYEPPKGDK